MSLPPLDHSPLRSARAGVASAPNGRPRSADELGLLKHMNTAFGAFIVVAAIPLAGQWLNFPTPGIPRLPDGSANLAAKAPNLADGPPDLSGVWAAKGGIYDGSRCFVQSYYFDLAQDLPAEAVQMTPWAEGIARQ